MPLQRGAVPRALRARREGGLRRGGVPVPLRLPDRRDQGAPGRQRPEDRAAQPAGRRLGTPASAASPARPTGSTSSAKAWRARSRSARRSGCRRSTAWPARPDGRDRGDAACHLRRQPARYAAAELKKAGLKLPSSRSTPTTSPASTSTARRRRSDPEEVGSDNPSCSTTSTTRSAWKASSRPTIAKHLTRIATSSSPTIRAATRPGTGEINYLFLFAHLDRIGYGGWIGCRTSRQRPPRAGPRRRRAAGAGAVAPRSALNHQDSNDMATIPSNSVHRTRHHGAPMAAT